MVLRAAEVLPWIKKPPSQPLAETKSGLAPGKILEEILYLRGINPYDVDWPLHRQASEPLFAHPDGSSLSSSGRKKGVNMLRRVRAVAAALKFRGHPDLLNTEIRTLQNYWLKITGDSVMHTRNVKPHMINGQGRWRLHAQGRSRGTWSTSTGSLHFWRRSPPPTFDAADPRRSTWGQVSELTLALTGDCEVSQ